MGLWPGTHLGRTGLFSHREDLLVGKPSLPSTFQYIEVTVIVGQSNAFFGPYLLAVPPAPSAAPGTYRGNSAVHSF